jgi:hypothetical protein
MKRIRIRNPGQSQPLPARTPRPLTKAIDILTGYVREVVDGRTIDLNLTAPTAAQLERYRGSELVRLVGATAEGANGTEVELRARLYRKHVRCFVHGRDSDGRLLAVAVPVARAG